jgi:hypothetical protein
MCVCRLLIFSSLAASLVCTSSAIAGSFSFSGNFSHDDNRLQIWFLVSGTSTVTLQTRSYAGDGSLSIPSGGFAPVLSLFDSFGKVTGNFDSGGVAPNDCAPRNIDPTTNYCLDAYLRDVLTPGSYLLDLTEYDNIPVGPNLSDGFLEQGQGDFTGRNVLGMPGAFIDPGGNQRTSSYFVTVDGVASASTVPEPSTALCCALALVLCFWKARKRARRRDYGNSEAHL